MSDVHIKRFKASEVTVVSFDGKFRFPCADGTLKQFGQVSPRVQLPRNPSGSGPGVPGETLKASDAEDVPELVESDSDSDSDSSSSSSDDDEPIGQNSPDGTRDFWSISGDALIRFHRKPRRKLFVPDEKDVPIPLSYIDVRRRTETDLESLSERTIQDYWNVDGPTPMSSEWTGKTVFYIRRPRLPPGFVWIDGRPTRQQATTRPFDTYGRKCGSAFPPNKRERSRSGHVKRSQSCSKPVGCEISRI